MSDAITTARIMTRPIVINGRDHHNREAVLAVFDLGGGSGTISIIVVLISIITILSGTALEATVKALVTLTLSTFALVLGYQGRASLARPLTQVRPMSLSLSNETNDRRIYLQKVGRLIIGSIIAGALLAIVVAVILSTSATQILNRLS